jgi:hypothetical protein
MFFLNWTKPMLVAHNKLRYVLRTQVQYPNIKKNMTKSWMFKSQEDSTDFIVSKNDRFE